MYMIVHVLSLVGESSVHCLQISSEYSVLFEDTTYPDGYSPPLDVPQRYVLPVRETRKK